jgi:hypothetical protein
VLCGACDPVCPEDIALGDMIMDLRRELARDLPPVVAPVAEPPPAGALLLPGADLRADAALLARVAGAARAAPRRPTTAPTSRWRWKRAARSIPPAGGASSTCLTAARWWSATACCCAGCATSCHGARLQGLGEALGNLPALRRRIASADFYVIEARAYHADHARLVAHYDDLRKETGCAMNLDLQRIAIPACDEAEARWMLKGRRPARIVVENPADRDILRRVADVPVLHLAELNGEAAHA